uniref:Uncharacterized protein n=1 Tax=Kalanchoe fedtschenkoi TaxID=63787 RepID=A0A7N1A5S2_KALFE
MIRVEKIKGVENQVIMGAVGDNKVAVESLMLEESAKEEPKKKLCMCSPIKHPGSFRCRYHRSTPTQNLKPFQNNAAMKKDFLKLQNQYPLTQNRHSPGLAMQLL